MPHKVRKVLIGKHLPIQNTLNKAFMAKHTFYGTKAMSSPLSFHRTRRRTLIQWLWRDWRWPSIRWGWLCDACNMAAKVATFGSNIETETKVWISTSTREVKNKEVFFFFFSSVDWWNERRNRFCGNMLNFLSIEDGGVVLIKKSRTPNHSSWSKA